MNFHQHLFFDPGLLRLKQAIKTVLAICIAITFTLHTDPMNQLFAALIAGFAMQGITTQHYYKRILYILFFSLSFFLAFLLGALVKTSSFYTSVVLTTLAFFACYVTRFGPDFKVAPKLIWAFCLMATILPFSNLEEATASIYGLIVGVLTAVFINVFFFMSRPETLFANTYLKLISTIQRLLKSYIKHADLILSSADFKNIFYSKKTRLLNYISFNNTLIEQMEIKNQDNARLLILEQYASIKATSMLTEVYEKLNSEQKSFHPKIKNALIKLLLSLSYYLKKSNHNNHDVQQSLEHFQQVIEQHQTEIKNDPVIYLNLQLSMQLLYQHIKKMVTMHVN